MNKTTTLNDFINRLSACVKKVYSHKGENLNIGDFSKEIRTCSFYASPEWTVGRSNYGALFLYWTEENGKVKSVSCAEMHPTSHRQRKISKQLFALRIKHIEEYVAKGLLD